MTDPKRIIVAASDSEGNSFVEIDNVELMKYDPEEQSVGMEKLTEELKEAGYSKDDVMKRGVKAFVLWP